MEKVTVVIYENTKYIAISESGTRIYGVAVSFEELERHLKEAEFLVDYDREGAQIFVLSSHPLRVERIGEFVNGTIRWEEE